MKSPRASARRRQHVSTGKEKQTAKIGGARSADQLPATETRATPAELAMLAMLMAINHTLQHQEVRKKPEDFLSAAYALLDEAEQSMPFHFLAEGMNNLAGISRGPDNPLSREVSWKEALAVQTEAPKDRSSLSRLVVGAPDIVLGGRIRSDNEFGQGTFYHDDLVNRPVGISMVGSLGTGKALRNAIKRVFCTEDAKEIIDRKTLTLRESNKILRDQLRIHQGRIPKVRPAKTETS